MKQNHFKTTIIAIHLLAIFLITACTPVVPANELLGTPGLASTSGDITATQTPKTPDAPTPILSPTPVEESINLYISAESAECVGIDDQGCLVVRFTPNGEWEYLQEPVSGFTFEPGFDYKLAVNKITTKSSTGGSPTIFYELIKIIEKKQVADMANNVLTGTQWDLIGYGDPANPTLPLANGTISLNFTPDGIGGSAGCNGYGASYTLVENEILVNTQGFATTLMACADPVMTQEFTYLEMLHTANSFSIVGKKLTIQTAQGVLIYALAEPLPLEGTYWRLSGLVENGAVVSTWLDDKIYIFFSEGNASGSSGCNQFTGGYSLQGNDLQFGPTVGTMMLCADDEINARETAFLMALSQVTGYKIERRQLMLLNADEDITATFTALDTSPISPEELGNAAYKTEFTDSGMVRLKDGEYRQPLLDGTTAELIIRLQSEFIAAGQLTQNPVGETAAVLSVSSGGSGTFFYLVIMQRTPDDLVNLASLQIGDRVQIQSLSIEENQVVLDVIRAGADDPLCCPTQHVIERYELRGEILTLASSEPVSD